MDVFYDLDDLEVIVDTYILDPSDPRTLERLYVVRTISTAVQQLLTNHTRQYEHLYEKLKV